MCRSLDNGAGGTLIDACPAVHTFIAENDGDILDQDGILRAHIGTCATGDTFTRFYGRHLYDLVRNRYGR